MERLGAGLVSSPVQAGRSARAPACVRFGMIRGSLSGYAIPDKPSLVPVKVFGQRFAGYTGCPTATVSAWILVAVYTRTRGLWVQVCGYSGYMATKVRHIRVPDDVWKAAKARAHAEGTSASAVAVEALTGYGQPWVRQGAARAPGPREPVQRPEPDYAAEDGVPCRHPSASVTDGVCGACGTEVWLR